MNPATLPPGFRFHPTDEELILHYLRNRAAAAPCPVSIVAEVDIYKFDPWDLPGKALFGDREWYFFSPRDRKYPNGVRPNRAAASGYWKATGTDRPIFLSKGGNGGAAIGVKKALVFYKGRPPKGVKTDWIMHEYRLAEAVHGSSSGESLKLRGPSSMRLDDSVLCRIYKKKASMDPDQEDSALDSEADNSQANSFLKLPKACSLSELLDAADCSAPARVLENPAEVSAAEIYPLLHHYGNGGLVPQLNQRDSPASIADQAAKRKQMCFEEDDLAELWFPAKKSATTARTFPCFDSSKLSRQLLVNYQNVGTQRNVMDFDGGMNGHGMIW